ncbi:hypothetical protein BOTBODRAFT_174148 [Botryobasidium botryosum FD-172 SS1]|uniref:Uncharacterized protein n=1 Tax=Botryobasidium botryosum (strain FD-172 SS1) TaxID=930990 RepID=A0A067MU09_BOTB1|nr:hypothetical protein BOTBODRAFT_174148 [Botryobasidium botryosum FD-172 SS1]
MDEEDKGGQTIPADISRVLGDGPCDKQEYDSYCGGNLTRHYTRSVLVIWPNLRDAEIAYGGKYLEHALESLRTVTSTKPSSEERRFIEDALASHHPDAGPAQVLQSVCTAACRWGDLELWHRAMRACGGCDNLERLGLDCIMNAIAKFGYDDLLPRAIESKVKGTKDSSLDDWISKKREAVLGSLGPLVAGEDHHLIQIVKAPGGIAALQRKIVPQVESNSKPGDLLSLALALHTEQTKKGSCFKSSADKEIGSRMGTRLLLRAIKHEDFFGLVESSGAAPSYHSYWPPYHARRTPSTKLTERYLEACLSTGNESLIAEVVKQLTVVPPTTVNTGSTTAERNSMLIALVPYFSKMVEERSASLPPLPATAIDLFYKTTIPLLLVQMQKAYVGEDEVTSVVRAAAIAGGVESLERTVLPQFKAVGRDAGTYKFFIQQLEARKAQFAAKPSPTSSIPAIVTDLVKTMINRLDLIRSVATTMDMLEFCYEVGNGPCYADVLVKIVEDGSRKASSIETFLLLLIPDLVGFASRRGISITAPPLVSYFQTVVRLWRKGVLGSKPPAKLPLLACAQRVTCRCKFCPNVVKFLSSCTEQSLELTEVGAPGVKHLEKTLGPAGVEAVAPWSTVMTVPRGFKLTKTNEAHQASRWKINQQKGIAALKSISTDENVLASVFECKYGHLMRCLDVPWINAAVRAEPGSATTTQPSASTSATTAGHARRPATRPVPEDGNTNPSKRRKVDHADTKIIDLT